VKIGGGGFIDGLVSSAWYASGAPQLLIRTDVGGLYSMRNRTGRIAWRALSDGFGFESRNLYGTSAMGFAGNSSIIFKASGAYPFDGASYIFGSDNAGTQWQQLTPPDWHVPLCSNSAHTRGSGERLVAMQG